jgi:catechol 2,3-dioxygenase-like lactoylglutathione lyase family enzyme
MTLRSLDHVTVQCADLARSRRFYTEALGMTDGWRPNFSFPGAWLYVGERPVVHLLGGREENGPISTGSFDHFALEAEDYEVMAARFESLGLTFDRADVPGAPVRQLFVLDPDGVKVELNFRQA